MKKAGGNRGSEPPPAAAEGVTTGNARTAPLPRADWESDGSAQLRCPGLRLELMAMRNTMSPIANRLMMMIS